MATILAKELAPGDRLLCAGRPEVIEVEPRAETSRVAVLLSDGRTMEYGVTSTVAVEVGSHLGGY